LRDLRTEVLGVAALRRWKLSIAACSPEKD
jgi:hypothetical protein